MKWRRWVAAGFVLAILLVAGAAGLVWTGTRPPEFYREAMAPPADPVERKTNADAITRQTERLVEEVRSSNAWEHEFDQVRINAWLAEELERKLGAEIPSGIREPRVRLVDGAVDLAFRAVDPKGRGEAVISLRVAPRLVGPNRLELEIVSIRTGLLRLPVDRILDEAAKRLESTRWRATRSRREGREVFTLDLSDVLPERAQLTTLTVRRGRIEVGGERSQDADSVESAE